MSVSSNGDTVMPPARAGATARDVAFQGLPDGQRRNLERTLYPEDSFQDSTYWADLPAGQRTKWITRQQNQEVKREFSLVWRMFISDPLMPGWKYAVNFMTAGLGFLAEGYVLFSVGNILTLFEAVWPQCFKEYEVCNKTTVQAINYLEIVGIIVGQIMVGIIGDWVGRRWGVIQDATTMFIGTVLLTAMWGTSLQGWVIMYMISLLIFGIGVGGEYPMTSTSAMEGVHGRRTSRDDKLHRGRNVLLAFLMQGWGQLLNQGVLIICLLIFHGNGNPPYSEGSAQPTFRVSFAVAAVFLLGLMYIRIYKLRNIDHAAKSSKKSSNVTGYDVKSLKLVMSHYWHRLFATSVCWFCNDFPFYGNQIFRNIFLQLVTSNEDQVMTLWLYNMINVGCELVGYYLAALLIDHKLYGRKRMQAVGFLMSFILFIIASGAFPILNVKGPGSQAFEFIYFFSSFWIQFGPNSTTFLLAAEVYPAPVRSTAHGLSAAVGKLGALAATVLYNYIGSQAKFWVVSWFGLIGFVLTIVFIPDTTGLDLQEQERYWLHVREGRPHEYHGVAVHHRHLSLFERVVLKRHLAYDPELDKEARLHEMRTLYEKTAARDSSEAETGGDTETLLGEEASQYFAWEKQSGRRSTGAN